MNKKPKNFVFDFEKGTWQSSRISTKPMIRAMRRHFKAKKADQAEDISEAMHLFYREGPKVLEDPKWSTVLTDFFECSLEELKANVKPALHRQRDYRSLTSTLIETYTWEWDFFEKFLNRIGFKSPTYRPVQTDFQKPDAHSLSSLNFYHPAGFCFQFYNRVEKVEDNLYKVSPTLHEQQNQLQTCPVDYADKHELSLLIKSAQASSGSVRLHYSGLSQLDRYETHSRNESLCFSTPVDHASPILDYKLINALLHVKLYGKEPGQAIPPQIFLDSYDGQFATLIDLTDHIQASPALNRLKKYWANEHEFSRLSRHYLIDDAGKQAFENPIDSHDLEKALDEIWALGEHQACFDILYYYLSRRLTCKYIDPQKPDQPAKDQRVMVSLDAAPTYYNIELKTRDNHRDNQSVFLSSQWHQRWASYLQQDMRYFEHLNLNQQLKNESTGAFIEEILAFHAQYSDVQQQGFSMKTHPFQSAWMESSLLSTFLAPQEIDAHIGFDVKALEQRCQAYWQQEELVHPFKKGITLIDAMIRTMIKHMDKHNPSHMQLLTEHFQAFIQTVPQSCVEAWACQKGVDQLTGPQRLILALLGDCRFTNSTRSNDVQVLQDMLAAIDARVSKADWVWETQTVNLNGLFSVCRTRLLDRNYVWEEGLNWLLESSYLPSLEQRQPDFKAIVQTYQHTQTFEQSMPKDSPQLTLQSIEQYSNKFASYFVEPQSGIGKFMGQSQVRAHQVYLNENIAAHETDTNAPKKRL